MSDRLSEAQRIEQAVQEAAVRQVPPSDSVSLTLDFFNVEDQQHLDSFESPSAPAIGDFVDLPGHVNTWRVVNKLWRHPRLNVSGKPALSVHLEAADFRDISRRRRGAW